MGVRDQMFAMLDALLDFGKVTASKQATQTKQVLVSVRGNSDGTNHEERPYQALWGHAAILFRPPPDTELIFWRAGDEMVPVASREIRWAIDVEEGEVVIRNLVSNSSEQARIHFKKNGEVVIDSPKVYVGDGGATEKIGLGTAIKGHFDDIKTHLNSLKTDLTLVKTHTHSVAGGDGGTATVSPDLTAMTNPSPPSVPDVESRHVVEN